LIAHGTMKEIRDAFQFSANKSTSFDRIKAIFISKIKNTMNYKSAYLMTVALNLLYIFMFYFFGKLNPDIEIAGIPVTYFEYAFIGLSIQMVVGTALATTDGSVYTEIITGTWSALLLHFNIFEYALGVSLAGIFLASFSIFIALGVAQLFLNLHLLFTFCTLLFLFVLFLLIMLAHITISCLFSAFTIWYKRRSDFVSLVYGLSKTFAGVTFPVVLLRAYPFAFILSRMLPLTYGLNGLHNILFNPNFLPVFLLNTGILLVFIVVVGIVALYLVKLSIIKIKIDGSVDHY